MLFDLTAIGTMSRNVATFLCPDGSVRYPGMRVPLDGSRANARTIDISVFCHGGRQVCRGGMAPHGRWRRLRARGLSKGSAIISQTSTSCASRAPGGLLGRMEVVADGTCGLVTATIGVHHHFHERPTDR